MKKCFFIPLFFCLTLLCANEVKERPKMPLEQALPIVTPLEDIAICIGNGPVKVHVFIDPFCPRSRDFVSFVSSSEKMLSHYRYYFYLYRLERFKSQDLIHAIYNEGEPLATMLDIMVRDRKYEEPVAPSETALNKIARVAEAARRIDVYKRPYMIMVKKKKPKKHKKPRG